MELVDKKIFCSLGYEKQSNQLAKHILTTSLPFLGRFSGLKIEDKMCFAAELERLNKTTKRVYQVVTLANERSKFKDKEKSPSEIFRKGFHIIFLNQSFRNSGDQ